MAANTTSYDGTPKLPTYEHTEVFTNSDLELAGRLIQVLVRRLYLSLSTCLSTWLYVSHKYRQQVEAFIQICFPDHEHSFFHPHFVSFLIPNDVYCIRTAILHVWSVVPWEYPRLFQKVHEVKNIFILLRHYLPFTLCWHLHWFEQKHLWVTLVGLQ